MQASFTELVGMADTMAASAALAAIERQELDNELDGLTPSVAPAQTRAGGGSCLEHQASEGIPNGLVTMGSCYFPLTCVDDGAVDLTHEATAKSFSGGVFCSNCFISAD